MTLDIKSPGRLENDLLKHASHTSPVIILDTGALIDIVQATRDFSLFASGKRVQYPHYSAATPFLRYIAQRIPILITPKTYAEIYNHRGVILNSHTLELGSRIIDHSFDISQKTSRFFNELACKTSFDDARYDTYWASLEGCNGNHKKANEGCSETDKEILAYAAHISSCRKPEKPDGKINPVLVVSPDLHVINGSRILRNFFDGKYSDIIPISTRA